MCIVFRKISLTLLINVFNAQDYLPNTLLRRNEHDALPLTRAEPRARGRASARAPHAGGWRGRGRW